MQTELWGVVQAKVSQFDDLTISELFQTNATREAFKKQVCVRCD